MKKWQKVLIWIIIILAVLIGGGYGVFKFYIQPKYIDKAVDQVSNILQNETVQNEVDKFVEELREEGFLTDEQVEEYMKSAEELGLNRAAGEEELEPETAEGTQEPKDETSPPQSTKSVKPNTKKDNGAPEYITGDGKIDAPDSKGEGSDTATSSPSSTTKPKKDTSKSKTERVMSELSGSELSFVNSIQSKIDVGTATSLMNSDYDEFKRYIKSHLSGDEISKCLSLYTKYAYLLSD